MMMESYNTFYYNQNSQQQQQYQQYPFAGNYANTNGGGPSTSCCSTSPLPVPAAFTNKQYDALCCGHTRVGEAISPSPAAAGGAAPLLHLRPAHIKRARLDGEEEPTLHTLRGMELTFDGDDVVLDRQNAASSSAAAMLHVAPNGCYDYYEPSLYRYRCEGVAVGDAASAPNGCGFDEASSASPMALSTSVSPQNYSGSGSRNTARINGDKTVVDNSQQVRVFEIDDDEDDDAFLDNNQQEQQSKKGSAVPASHTAIDDDEEHSPSHNAVSEVIKSLITKRPISNDARLLQKMAMTNANSNITSSSSGFNGLAAPSSSSVLMLTWNGSSMMADTNNSKYHRLASPSDHFLGHKRMRPTADDCGAVGGVASSYPYRDNSDYCSFPNPHRYRHEIPSMMMMMMSSEGNAENDDEAN